MNILNTALYLMSTSANANTLPWANSNIIDSASTGLVEMPEMCWDAVITEHDSEINHPL